MTTLAPLTTLCIFLIVFLGTCVLFKINVAFGIGIGSLAITLIGGYHTTFFLQGTFSALDSFPFLAVPTFILAGVLMEQSGIAGRLLDWCNSIVGRVRGSIGAVTAFACAAFGLLTGSATSTLSAIGRVMINEMTKRGYRKSYAAALAASTAFLGILIPPSVPGIIYALSAGCSITDIWMATVVPGVIICIGTIFLNWWIVGRKEGKPKPLEGGFGEYITNLSKQTIVSIPALVMPIIVFGGIYSGIFTPTEAGAVCVAYGLLYYGYRVITGKTAGKSFKKIFDEAAIGTASIGLLTAFALATGRILTMTRISEHLANWVLANCTNKWTFLLLYNIVLLFMGMFMSGNATILILTPLLLPTAQAFGIGVLEFGTIMLVANCYGGLTPPFATYNFIASNFAGEPFGKVTKESLPFLILGYVVIFIICVFPQSYLWLPRLLAAS
jgi:C4-dicarboxylate transporter DctM subunit